MSCAFGLFDVGFSGYIAICLLVILEILEVAADQQIKNQGGDSRQKKSNLTVLLE